MKPSILGREIVQVKCVDFYSVIVEVSCFLCDLILPSFFKNFYQEIQATWYEKLHEWEDALVAYDKKIDMNKEDPELILGRMRCLEALGEWYVISRICCEFSRCCYSLFKPSQIHKYVYSVSLIIAQGELPPGPQKNIF